MKPASLMVTLSLPRPPLPVPARFVSLASGGPELARTGAL